MEPRDLVDLAAASPRDAGSLRLIVARLPGEGRETPTRARLAPLAGLEGDRWSAKANAKMAAQVSLMNAGVLAALAGDASRMSLAGDNLVVDLDLGEENAPVGTRLAVGEAVLEITDEPHTGCSKFRRRYGDRALALVNSPEGLAARLRGVYARVVLGGEIRVGDAVRKVGREPA